MTAQTSSGAPLLPKDGIEAPQDAQVDADVMVTLNDEIEESEDNVFVTSPVVVGSSGGLVQEQDAASHSVEECQMGSTSSFCENVYQAECDESYPAVQAEAPATRSKKGKKKKAAKRKKSTPASKANSSSYRPPRKRRSSSEAFTSRVDITTLPRRSSNRLRQKHENVDFSRAPPKYHGPPPPSLRFCDYVISELLTSQYEPINWLLELQTVKRKLTYRQYESAEEFANEIRTLEIIAYFKERQGEDPTRKGSQLKLCLNPIDSSLTDECLRLLHAFDKIWLYLPVDPEEPPPPPPVVLESVPVEEDVIDQNLEMLIEATEKAVNKVQSLILEVDSKRALLDDVRRKRRMAFSLGEDEPPIPQALLQSTQVTMDKCEAMLAPPEENVQPEVVKAENVEEAAESEETVELPSAASVEVVEIADETTTVPEPDDAGGSVPMTHQELIQLAKDLQRLSDDELQQVVIKSIMKFHTLSVPECSEEIASIEFEHLTPAALHEVRSHVSILLDGKTSDDIPNDDPLPFLQGNDESIVEVTVGLKSKKVEHKPRAARKQSQPARRRACIVDVEARKRELVEGIKKLGGTGTTRPIRKPNSYVIDEDSRERSSYAYDSSSESSSSSSEPWMSSPSSDSCSDSE